jgi:predicted O-methyltransferase YrrM
MSLSTCMLNDGVFEYQGHCGQIAQQVATLKHLCSAPSIESVLEIGFNVGHSADTFLANSLAHVTSFDIQADGCVAYGKRFIDRKYPTRHTLLIGDSTKILPRFIEQNPGKKFDLIFIDGGHTEEVAWADITNCKKLAHARTIVAVDDVLPLNAAHEPWSVGPSAAWSKAVDQGLIVEARGEVYGPGRGMFWGRYN